MPLFDYRCACCGGTQERQVRAPAPDVVVCAQCGSDAQRLVSLPARAAGECAPTDGPGAT